MVKSEGAAPLLVDRLHSEKVAMPKPRRKSSQPTRNARRFTSSRMNGDIMSQSPNPKFNRIKCFNVNTSLAVGATGWSPLADSRELFPRLLLGITSHFSLMVFLLYGATIVPFKIAAARICCGSSYSSIFRHVPLDRQTSSTLALLSQGATKL